RFSRDWSSDVCSSDLSWPGGGSMSRPAASEVVGPVVHRRGSLGRTGRIRLGLPSVVLFASLLIAACAGAVGGPSAGASGNGALRSEERRVGKGSTDRG